MALVAWGLKSASNAARQRRIAEQQAKDNEFYSDIDAKRKQDRLYDLGMKAWDLGYRVGVAAAVGGGAEPNNAVLQVMAEEAADELKLVGEQRGRFVPMFVKGFRWGW